MQFVLLKNLKDITKQLIPELDLLLVALAVHLDQGPPVAGVDLVARIHAEVYLHDDFVFCNTTDIRLGEAGTEISDHF